MEGASKETLERRIASAKKFISKTKGELSILCLNKEDIEYKIKNINIELDFQAHAIAVLKEQLNCIKEPLKAD